MKTISPKSKAILAKIGIITYKRRENLGQNFLDSIVFHKRDSIMALLQSPLDSHTKEEQNLFISIMNTMTSQKPLIEEFSESFDSNNKNEPSLVIKRFSKETKGIISFGISADIKNSFIQAPSLASMIDNQELKKPLWKTIKKTFIK